MLKTPGFLTTVRTWIWVGLSIGIITSAQAHPATNDMPFVGLVVLPELNLRLMGRNQADYILGRLSALDHPQVEHRFTLRNEGKKPLTITELEPTCHCTIATVEKIAGQEPAPTDGFIYHLPPGQEMAVKVTVQLAQQPSGPMSHGVDIHVLGNQGPVARLHLTGEMEVSLMVTPTELDFGQIKLGETQSRTLTIMCDDRLLSGGMLPRLEGECDTGPWIKTGSIIKVVPQKESPSASIKSVSAMRERTYVVTVQPGQTGDLTARLFFASPDPSESKGTIPNDRAMDVLRGVQVPVRAEVTEK